MGSFISSHAMYAGKSAKNTCFLCSNQITENKYIKCVRCNILLHDDCEKQFSNTCYTICPRCDRCGSLGQIDL